ncbi:MAG: PCMD domain-containing protein [Paludibacteraceae bacterium]|nr:PCMD domain-containing protein [Paludibacteraceae bacterium]
MTMSGKRYILLLVLFVACMGAAGAERVVDVPFGNMESWVTRYIKESRLIGGKTQTLYCVAPPKVINENKPYAYAGRWSNPWTCSNAYAKVAGIEKAACTAMPERSHHGSTCARLDVKMQQVKVLGMIDVSVIAAGTLFWGRTIEPITTAKDPYRNLDFGVPFTTKPSYLMFDYKCTVSPENWVWHAKGLTAPKKQAGHDECEVYLFLQKRWETPDGKIHAVRVGTAYERYGKTQAAWVDNHRIKVHYGDITKQPFYKSYMGLTRPFRAMNSKGKIVYIDEEGWDGNATPTHAILMMTSGRYEAFVGHEGNVLWVDNIRLVYDD